MFLLSFFQGIMKVLPWIRCTGSMGKSKPSILVKYIPIKPPHQIILWLYVLNFPSTSPRKLVWKPGLYLHIFSCDQAALWMVQSVRLSVCPSVCLSHLFDYVPIILSSWNFQELLPVTKVTSMQNVKVRGQRSRSQRSRPKFSFPDCNSSLNSHMMMKWYI